MPLEHCAPGTICPRNTVPPELYAPRTLCPRNTVPLEHYAPQNTNAAHHNRGPGIESPRVNEARPQTEAQAEIQRRVKTQAPAKATLKPVTGRSSARSSACKCSAGAAGPTRTMGSQNNWCRWCDRTVGTSAATAGAQRAQSRPSNFPPAHTCAKGLHTDRQERATGEAEKRLLFLGGGGFKLR